MNWKTFLRLFKAPIEAIVTTWLQIRALVIPESQKAAFAKKYGISPDNVQAFALELGQVAVSRLDSLLK